VLTGRGWLLLVVAGTLWLAGRLLGLLELHILAVAAVVAVVGAVLYVRGVPHGLEASRQVRPQRAHVGASCRVDLTVANPGRRSTPSLVAEEPFDDGRLTARFDVPALAPGGTGRAAYRVPTTRRGLFTLGPLAFRLTDPFGLASARSAVGGTSTILVYPKIEAVAGLPPAPGSDPEGGAHNRTGRHHGEDLYALRPYEVGDDLRRVHWPASARSDELMIRQLELPWQHRATVVLDVRRALYTEESFEAAVTAAASILTASHHDRAVTRLVTTAGHDSGFGSGRPHWEAAMTHLARVRATGAANLAATMARMRRGSTGSSVAVVTGAGIGAGDRGAVASLRERVGLILLVRVGDADGPGWTVTQMGATRPGPRPQTASSR
jgi:uncharacterized protein (DUF58 family)